MQLHVRWRRSMGQVRHVLRELLTAAHADLLLPQLLASVPERCSAQPRRQSMSWRQLSASLDGEICAEHRVTLLLLLLLRESRMAAEATELLLSLLLRRQHAARAGEKASDASRTGQHTQPAGAHELVRVERRTLAEGR